MYISNQNITFTFSPESKPAAVTAPGKAVTFQTLDCYCNQIKKDGDTSKTVKLNGVNPATGPLYIDGACPGDTLKIKIEKIRLDPQGFAAASPGYGTLAPYVSETCSRIIRIKDNFAIFNDNIRIPVSPMIGVIGVASAEGKIATGTPGRHGGNMDNTMIKEGCTLYLPVMTDGALLAVGDLHAVMGDGEISGTGTEISGEVRLVPDLIKGRQSEWPVLETEEVLSVIVSDASLDTASEKAANQMFLLLREIFAGTLKDEEIIMLMSLAGNLQICQIVNDLKTVRFSFCKNCLPKGETL